MPSNEPYHLLHTASMVGLFSCVFIKASQRHQVRNINAAEIKRGMGGLHGNKVSIGVGDVGYRLTQSRRVPFFFALSSMTARCA